MLVATKQPQQLRLEQGRHVNAVTSAKPPATSKEAIVCSFWHGWSEHGQWRCYQRRDGGSTPQYYYDKENVRRLCVLQSSNRRSIGKQMVITQPADYTVRARCEIDTRANTFCTGKTFLLHEHLGNVVDVGGFHPSLAVIKYIPIGLVVTAYDLPDGETIMLGIQQALFGGTQWSTPCANQTSFVNMESLWTTVLNSIRKKRGLTASSYQRRRFISLSTFTGAFPTSLQDCQLCKNETIAGG